MYQHRMPGKGKYEVEECAVERSMSAHIQKGVVSMCIISEHNASAGVCIWGLTGYVACVCMCVCEDMHCSACPYLRYASRTGSRQDSSSAAKTWWGSTAKYSSFDRYCSINCGARVSMDEMMRL